MNPVLSDSSWIPETAGLGPTPALTDFCRQLKPHGFFLLSILEECSLIASSEAHNYTVDYFNPYIQSVLLYDISIVLREIFLSSLVELDSVMPICSSIVEGVFNRRDCSDE